MAFVETPRTNLGDTTDLGFDGIENVSPEKSWHAPAQQGNDLVSKLRTQRGLDLRTPNSRNPLTLRPNQQKPASDEISLLLKSTARPPVTRAREKFGVPQTPAVLKRGYKDVATPGLEAGDSLLASSEAGSYADGRTPLPAIPSSSAHSTPLADLGGRNMNGLVSDARNQMTLREQEAIIDKLEKDNFGLKLKIHYLEEILRKADPNYSQTAVKENADLKVERLQLQRDVSKLRKQIKVLEEECERLRIQLLSKERDGKRSGQDGAEARADADRLRHELQDLHQQMDDMKEELQQAGNHQSRVEKLENDVEDLEAELRQKDVEINERDEKLEKMDEKIEELQAEAEKREEELEESRDNSEEMQELKDKITDLEADYRALENDLDLAKEAQEDAEQQKEEALENLKELQDDMANKSMHPSGFAEEIQQKAKKFERELREALAKHDVFEQQLSQRDKEAHDLKTRFDLSREEATSREQTLRVKVEDYERQIRTLTEQHDSSDGHLQSMRQKIEASAEERDALRDDSERAAVETRKLQQELEECRKEIQELQDEMEFERRQASETEAALREETNADREDLQADIYDLRRRLESVQDELEAEQERWDTEKRQMALQKDQAEARSEGLEETVKQLQAARDNISGQESRLQDVLSGEEQRHRREENLLRGQMEQMELEIQHKQQSVDQLRAEQSRTKEEVWLSKQDAVESGRKVQALEDEIQVLSGMLEDEQRRSGEQMDQARRETDSLRKELLDVRQAKQRVENNLKDVQDMTQRIPQTPAATRDARLKLEQKVREQDSQLERFRYQQESLEAKLKRTEEDLVTAKRRTSELEGDIRRTLASKAARSPAAVSVSISDRKELEELRRQLAEARREADDALEKRKSAERELRNKLSEAEATSRQRLYLQDQLRDEFEARISELESQLRESEALRQSAEKTTARLRARMDILEKDLQNASSRQNRDDTLLDARSTLENRLREAKLEVDSLSKELAVAGVKLKTYKDREAEQKVLVKRLRSERSEATTKKAELEAGLQDLQAKLDLRDEEQREQREQQQRRQAKEATRQHEAYEIALATLTSDLERQHASTSARTSVRHQQELAGLMKQIQWLRAKARREEVFRAGLAFEKRFLLMNVEMYQSFNQVDLKLLNKITGMLPPDGDRDRSLAGAGVGNGMGRVGDRDKHGHKEKYGMGNKDRLKPNLKAAAYLVIAIHRMSKGAEKWRESRRLKESLVREVEMMHGTTNGRAIGRERGALGKRKVGM